MTGPNRYDIDKIAPDRDNRPDIPPYAPGWRREENTPHPVAPDAAPGAAPTYRPGTPTK